ncbi:serine/threonine-protein kinase [Shewanella sp. 4_MG-2023]|uniref:serine/threonine-protein kinase n=1 Tax=Shewanella sp. 4_MG-2023 TaxID=3062652 RepID=UPI0026E33AB4|nr:serine/threonine-protein kinase [Shewanella sp. 4_MG-2023]MDO6677078.1 serine/threonine-protein kinase [Shewanella sp. 4_MG-2023]
MDASDIYAELIELSADERKVKLAEVNQHNSRLANDLAAMLAMNCTDVTQYGHKLFCINDDVSEQNYLGCEVLGFTLTRLLSDAGATGVVFLGEQTIESAVTDENCTHFAAIKVLKVERLAKEQTDNLFFRESSNLIALNHARICRLYGVSNIKRNPCLITEFVDGKQLDAHLKQDCPSHKQRLQIFEQLLEGMSHAHSRSLYHGDLKPQNILIDAQGEVKIIDLGFARQFEQNTSSLEQHYIHAFSRHWSAPEQVSGIWCKSRSDVYSLGVLLFYLLSGHLPESHGFDTDVQCPASLQLIPEINAESAAMIAKATHSDPLYRYREADEFLNDFKNWQQKRPVLAYSSAISYRFKKALYRNPVMSGISGALSLSLLVITINFIVQYFAILSEKKTNQEVIAQLSDILLYTRPELSHSFNSPKLDEVFIYAAKRWQQQQDKLTGSARYETAQIYLKGLLSLNELDSATELLDQLKQKETLDALTSYQRAGLDILELIILQRQDLPKSQCFDTESVETQGGESQRVKICPSQNMANTLLMRYKPKITTDIASLLVIVSALQTAGIGANTSSEYAQYALASVVSLIRHDEKAWRALPLQDKHALFQIFALPHVRPDFSILTEQDKLWISQQPQEWLTSSTSIANQYMTLQLAKMVAYNLDQVELTVNYTAQKHALSQSALKMTPFRLSFEPLAKVSLSDINTSQSELAKMEQVIIENYSESMATTLAAINSLASAYLYIGDLHQAEATLMLPFSAKFIAKHTDMGLFGTYPTQMELAIWHRDWNQFKRHFQDYQALLSPMLTNQGSNRGIPTQTHFSLFDFLLSIEPNSLTPEQLPEIKQTYLSLETDNGADIYLTYVLAVTGHKQTADGLAKTLISIPITEFFDPYAVTAAGYSMAPAWDDAVIFYARLLTHSGQGARSEALLANKIANNKYKYTRLMRLALGESLLQQGKRNEASKLWQVIQADKHGLPLFRKDFIAMYDKLESI